MMSALHRLLIHLLPRERRRRFGSEMQLVFADMRRDVYRANGAVGVGMLWMKETVGLVRFSIRDRLAAWRSRRARTSDPSRGRGGLPFLRELRWAWRGVRARRLRAVFSIVLLGVAMATNVIVFSAADAFIFNRAPYGQPDRLAVIGRSASSLGLTDYQSPSAVPEWRKERDLFTAVHAHERGASLYLTTEGVTDAIRAQQITPGLLEMLGVLPAWGRPFVAEDARPDAVPVAIISEALARRLFGSPAAALEQRIDGGTQKIQVVGVMASGFRFPTSREEIWRPLDLDSWPRYQGVRTIARLAPARSITDVSRLVTERAPFIFARAGESWRPEPTSARRLTDAWHNDNATVIFSMLLGAAGCLFLIACANVASLELQSAAYRSRIFAVQTALGAPRRTLVLAALYEAGLVLGAALALAIGLVELSAPAIMANLTTSMRETLVNPIDLDARALLFMLAIGSVAWALTSLPALVKSSQLNLIDALRDDPRVMPVTRGGARLRQVLMAGQVTLTVLLLVGAMLYVRTYITRLGLEKGFNAPGLVSVTVFPAGDAPVKGADLEGRVLETLRSSPLVRAVSRTWALPPSTEAGILGWLHVKGRGRQGRVKLSGYEVDPSYFETMNIPLVAGRGLSEQGPPGEMVVDDAFARKFWPNGDALGAVLRVGGEQLDFDKAAGGAGWNRTYQFEIVGITSRLRADQVQTAAGDDVFIVYIKLGATSVPLTFVARMHDAQQLPALTSAVRSVATRSIVRTNTLENRYAALEADKRLAAFTTSGFGVLALIVATAGIYAVMAFLVASRRREIGIRMALGADRGAVSRLIFTSSLTFVLAGAAIGLGGALVASRWISSQLFGVTATDPATYASVTGLVVVTALVATWHPARQASRIDPAITLRGE